VTEGHPSEDELVLHYYGELAPGDRAGIDRHLAACAACASARHALEHALGGIDAAVPEPDAGFEDRLWARLQPALPAPRPARPRAAVAAFFAAAATLAGAVATASLWIAGQPSDAARVPNAVTEAGVDTGARSRVLLTALDEHFSQTEILLVELLHATPNENASWAFQRTAADELVASNRLYRQTARQDGELQLANMLEDLEGVLVEIAAAPDEVPREDVDLLRARVEDNALLFKVRAVATGIRGRQERLLHRQ
jgi:hypothetical protein